MMFKKIILPSAIFFTAFLFFVSSVSAAETVISVSADIGNKVGQFKFELHKTGKGKYERWNEIPAEIRILKNDSKDIFQTLKTNVEIDDPTFDISDINGDGYKDMLLYNACAGYAGCASPSTAADVYLFIPKLNKFVKSKTLTGLGNISVLEKKGCVNVNYKCSDQDYIDEEWCFNISTGKWKRIKQSGCEEEQ